MNSTPSRKLCIGVMLDSMVAPRWVHYLLQQITQSDYAEVSLVILNAQQDPSHSRAHHWISRLRSPAASAFAAYCKVDYRLFRRKVTHDAFAETELSPLLATVDTLAIQPQRGRYIDRFDDCDIAAVQDYRLDVILRFGFRILKGAILQSAAYGIWSFHHGDNRYYRGGPALFWEMAEGNPESGSILQILSEDLDRGRVIYRSVSATCFKSLFLNRNDNYWKTAQFLLRRLQGLQQAGWEHIRSLATFNETGSCTQRLYRTPTLLQLGRFLLATASHLLKGQLRYRFCLEQWYIAISHRQADIIATIKQPQFQVIEPPPGRFLADPFVIHKGSQDFIFVEDYCFATQKGGISVLTVEADGRLSEITQVLERPYHLSYPFVFQQDNAYYMIPETCASRQVELYKAHHFPYDWRLERVLLENVDAVDPTLHWHDGRYWLFVNIAAHGAQHQDELHLYYATNLDGTWRTHRMNPVISHVGHARPAGRLFVWNNKLLRPAQNCTQYYGHHMWLKEITELTPETYAERDFDRIMPGWLAGSLCTHTLNFSDTLLVTDGKRYIRKH